MSNDTEGGYLSPCTVVEMSLAGHFGSQRDGTQKKSHGELGPVLPVRTLVNTIKNSYNGVHPPKCGIQHVFKMLKNMLKNPSAGDPSLRKNFGCGPHPVTHSDIASDIPSGSIY